MIQDTRLLVLGSTRVLGCGAEAYRGTYRTHPDYQSQLGADHEVNRAFSQFCEQGGESLVLSDINFARQLVGLYGKLDPPQVFDLVEAVSAGASALFSGSFLGYDISNGGVGYSLLSWGLRSKVSRTSEDPGLRAIEPLIRLLEAHFKPRLNSNGLFDDMNVAVFCLECMGSLQGLRPHLWESDAIERFELVALYLVPT